MRATVRLQSLAAAADADRMDRRREPRFETRLWVGIAEAEGEAGLEKCNISASGMLLATPRDVGKPGSVRMLRLVTADLGASIEVMAHVIRVVAHEDPVLGRVIEATAFELLPHQPHELDSFLSTMLEGDCTVPLAVHADFLAPDRLRVRGLLVSHDGTRIARHEETGAPGDARRLGEAVAEGVLRSGGQEILDAMPKPDVS